MEKNTAIIEKKGEIGFLILSQPKKGNMLNMALLRSITKTLEELNVDDEVRLIVVKGEGEHFCYGADLREIAVFDKSRKGDFFPELNKMLLKFHEIDKPTIAMVDGYAVAGGFSMALSCDLIVACEDAHFGSTAVNVGLFCTQTAGVILPRIVGSKKALEMGLTGDIITAKEAEKLGIVNKVVPREMLESATMELAEKILSKNPNAIVMGRRAFYDCADMGYVEGLKQAAEIIRQLSITDQGREGMMAFLSGRKPSYKRSTSYRPTSKEGA